MSAIHREHPEASPAEIDALLRRALAEATASPPNEEPKVTRTCRDCGSPFLIRASARHNKWGSLCGSCLAQEI